MRILLDECVPARLARELSGHDTTTVGRMRWSGIDDARLLLVAEAEFDVLITVDRSLEYQQPANTAIAIITLLSPSIEIQSIRPLVPEILVALETLQPGARLRIGGDRIDPPRPRGR